MDVMKTGDDVYLRLPSGSGERRLYKATVAGWNDDQVSLIVQDSQLDIRNQMQVMLYYEDRAQFIQQAARVDDLGRTETTLMVDVVTTGDASPAEERRQARISALPARLKVQVDGDELCTVNDVSTGGLSILCQADYPIGHIITVAFKSDWLTFSGTMQVRGVRSLGAGITRYGLMPERVKQSVLDKGLKELTEHLRRTL